MLLTVKPLSNEVKNSGKKYAVALKLRSKNGANDVLEPGSKLVCIIDQVIRQDVPVINSAARITFNMRQEYALTAWTVEMNVNIDRLGKGIG